jgi:hypothetical protein
VLQGRQLSAPINAVSAVKPLMVCAGRFQLGPPTSQFISGPLATAMCPPIMFSIFRHHSFALLTEIWVYRYFVYVNHKILVKNLLIANFCED